MLLSLKPIRLFLLYLPRTIDLRKSQWHLCNYSVCGCPLTVPAATFSLEFTTLFNVFKNGQQSAIGSLFVKCYTGFEPAKKRLLWSREGLGIMKNRYV